MLLSAEQFHEITSHLISDQAGRSTQRRKEPRVGVRFEAAITRLLPGSPAQPERITIRDLSRSGINIICHRQMQAGSQFMVKMVWADQHQATALYRVCHSKPLGSTLYSVGAALVSVSKPGAALAA